jgi:hypothetical protein
MDEHGVAGPHRIRARRQIVSGRSLEKRRGGKLARDAVGDGHSLCRVHGYLLGVASRRRGPRHAVSDRDLDNTLAHVGNRPGAFNACDKRRLPAVGAFALIDVAVVHADCLDVDNQLAGTRPGSRFID